jgi:GH24 family phage-related lysozyme (muramidase)
MGTGVTIKTGGNKIKTLGKGNPNNSYYTKADVYEYGVVLALIDEPNNTSIIYTPLRDSLDKKNNKKGVAYPYFPNNTKKPQPNQIVPLLIGPARQREGMDSKKENQYLVETYYLDPIDIASAVNGNFIDNNANVDLTSSSNYRTNRIGVDPEEESINLGTGWENIAANFIAAKESYAKAASWDENAYRAGYGTDKKLVNGKLIAVTKDTTFTKQEAIDTLAYQLKNEMGPILSKGLGKENWEKLNDNQKAALVSMGYNCGPYFITARNYGKAIKQSITQNNFQAAAQGILNGPTTGANSGKSYPGLVKRRQEEANLFLS